MSIPFLSLRDVSIRFELNGKGDKCYREPLRNISLDVYPGETLGVLGANGAGKSTLLRVLSGALQPDTGKVINKGASVALLALQAGFDQNLTGRDNAIFGGMLLGYKRSDVLARLEQVKAYSELGDYFEEPVHTYSSGMSSRLGFSISTIISPDILLVDEVLSVGDANFRKKAERTMIQKILNGQTVIIVSHSHSQIASLCDRCIILDNGSLVTGNDTNETLAIYKKILQKQTTP